MEPRLRNSSGPVEAMPKHKQAGHTTVLTKYAQTAQQNACNAGATHTGLSNGFDVLQCGTPDRTFAARARSAHLIIAAVSGGFMRPLKTELRWRHTPAAEKCRKLHGYPTGGTLTLQLVGLKDEPDYFNDQTSYGAKSPTMDNCKTSRHCTILLNCKSGE